MNVGNREKMEKCGGRFGRFAIISRRHQIQSFLTGNAGPVSELAIPILVVFCNIEDAEEWIKCYRNGNQCSVQGGFDL